MSARYQRARGTPAHHYLGRFLAGRHLDGKARSDATFFTRGTVGEPGYWNGGRESWWSMLAGWHRSAIRLGIAAVLVGLWRYRQATEWTLAMVTGPALGLMIVRAVRALQVRRHRRELVVPLASALSPFMGASPAVVESGLEVLPGYADSAGGEHVGSLMLPDEWPAMPEQRVRVQQVIAARLGIDLKYQWQTARYPLMLNLTRAPLPPSMVRFADYRAEIDACPPGKVVLGVAADGTLKYGDLALDDPHWAVNAGSRRGKTSLLLLIAAQELRKGAERVTAIDPKLVSLDALAGIPGVDLRDNGVEDMWAGILAFRQFVEGRIAEYKADRTTEFRRALLIIDEVNQFAAMSDHHWRQIKDKSDPAVPPVWNDIATVAWMGAQFRANIVVVGQRLDGPTLKNLRDSFGVRLLAGFTPQQYQFLVGLPPVLRSQKPRGRFLLFEGGELTWLQLVYGTEQELRDYAMEGRRGRPSPASELGPMPAPGTRDTPGVIVGLAAAAAHLGMAEEAFRKARQRRPVPGEMTQAGRPAWRPAALTNWRDSRPSLTAVQ